MALINCKECGNEVSTTASACPKCGAPQVGNAVSAQIAPLIAKKKLSSPAIVGLAFIGVFIGLSIPIYLEQREQDQKIEAEIERVKNLPEMPLEVKYREALLGSGLVASFKNTANRFLAVGVSLNNPSMHQQKSFRVDLAPGEVKEIGHMEGWAFSSGDTIAISHEEYRELEVKIP